MGKAILMSIRPQYVAKILNGDKTIEVRKKFPKDYVGWVYIYCTKKCNITEDNKGYYVIEDKNCRINPRFSIHGTVVARFWCDKVEEIYPEFEEEGDCEMGVSDIWGYHTQTFQTEEELLKTACIKFEDFYEYIDKDFCYESKGYAIRISKLEVFDKAKELKELKKVGYNELYNKFMDNCLIDRNSYENLEDSYSLTKAPQSWCYVED